MPEHPALEPGEVSTVAAVLDALIELLEGRCD